jgi:hypothetical protein
MALFDEVVEELQADPGVSQGVFFGHPAAKLGKKVFACEVEGDLLVKLGAERVVELQEAGAARVFDPMGGRPMNAWALVPEAESGDPLLAWVELAEEAKLYLAGE